MSPRAPAGIALQPVMDLTDRRVIAYEAQPRTPASDPSDVLTTSLEATRWTLATPLLIPIPPVFLLDEELDLLKLAGTANVSPSSVVFMLPTLGPGALQATIRRRAAEIRAGGFRVGLDGVRVLDLPWHDVVAIRPSFLILEAGLATQFGDETMEAALAGVLAFTGRLGARVVSRGVDSAEAAAALVRIGLFYGLGLYLQPPVVLDPSLAAEGDQVVRQSWFKERSTRRLPDEQELGTSDAPAASLALDPADSTFASKSNPNVFFVPSPPPRELVAVDEAFDRLIGDSASRFFRAASPAHLMQMLSSVMPHVLSFDRLAIFEADWPAYALQPRVLIGDELESIADVSHPLGTGITGWAFLRGLPYNCGLTAEHPEAAPIPGEPERDESLLVIPLTSQGRRIGVIDVWRDGSNRFAETDLRRCVLVAKIAADAWRLAEERIELEQRVLTDTGTGLLNKRWWDELAPREAAQAIRSGNRIAVLLVDLDGFKLVNDTYGHAIGDVVLNQVARALMAAIRSGDAAIRYGGDEFILMLRDCGDAGAIRVAEDVQVGVAAVTGPAASGLTASIGIAMFPDHGETLDEVVSAADAAMYEAKAAGRDRIVEFSEVPGTRGSQPLDTTAPAAKVRGALVGDLEAEHRRLAEAQRLAMVGSFEMGLDSGELEWSAELRRILGIPVGERPTAAGVIDRMHPEDLEGFARSLNEWIEAGATRFERTLRIVRDDGATRHIHMRVRARTAEDGRRVLSGTLQDVTERLESDRARQTAEEQFALAFEQGAIGMLMTDVNLVITRVNLALCELLGRPASEIVGMSVDAFQPAGDTPAQAPLVTRLAASQNGRIEAEYRFVRRDGSGGWVRAYLTLVRDPNDVPQYVFAQVEDITLRKRQEDEIRRLALEDPLTGLPNRQLLHDRLERALRRTRQSHTHVAVLLVDIDHFKRVNDSLGQAAGDRLLMEAARRMADGMRADDTVARLSGDEFVLLCEGVEDIAHAMALSDRLGSAFADPFPLDEGEMHVTVSCGVVLATGTESPSDLLRDAEAAMHQAKEAGRARSAVFDESIRTRATGRLDLEAALRHAVERREIYVVFQPIVRLRDEVIVGVEALARWKHPTRGMISPAEFIPIAEDTGLITALGENMLDAALEQVAAWRHDVSGWQSFFVAVNLSPRQLVAADLLERCIRALARHDLPPSSLRLEVTESTLMDDAELSVNILRGLSDAGILIAMDDFGTGFSSLSRLKRLPVSTLKIDRSFIDGLGTDPSDSSIVRAIMSLGHALNLELCAEGVELPLQRDELVRLGCQVAQGYLWSPGLAPEDFTRAFAPPPGAGGTLRKTGDGPPGD